jgi:hypothetical protein
MRLLAAASALAFALLAAAAGAQQIYEAPTDGPQPMFFDTFTSCAVTTGVSGRAPARGDRDRVAPLRDDENVYVLVHRVVSPDRRFEATLCRSSGNSEHDRVALDLALHGRVTADPNLSRDARYVVRYYFPSLAQQLGACAIPDAPVQTSGVAFLDAGTGDPGTAAVDVTVGPSGKVLATAVVSASSPRYGAYAERTARIQFYWPALARCVPVQGTYRFTLETTTQ